MTLSGLEGKVAVVTGAGSGIGAASARRLVQEGARVVCVDVDAEAAERTARGIGDAATWIGADVTDPAETDAYVGAALERFGRMDLLHANAGILGPVAPLVDMSDTAFDGVIAVNVRGAFLSVRAGMRAMTASGGGAIVVTSSILGVRGAFGSAAYAASKHAVIGLARTAAMEGGPAGIRVNVICPGSVETPMLDTLQRAISPDDPAQAGAMLRAGVPAGRDATAEEIAAASTWLLSDEAAFVSGAVLAVDGGKSAG